MTLDAVREAVARLNTAATALSAIAVALESRSAGRIVDPSIQARIDEVFAALELEPGLGAVSAEDLGPLLAEIRVLTATNARLLDVSAGRSGWAPVEPTVMQAAGDATARFPRALASTIAPKLEGLSDRLAAPGARFLDVGVGVAAFSIEMARTWPDLRVVGLDVWAPALAIARDNVRVAGLEGRVELREASGESIADEDAFDLAWIPSLFVPDRALPELLRRVHRALRRGGWLLLPLLKTGGDPLASSVARLRTALWGGSLSSREQVERWLTDAGFVDVRRLPSASVANTEIVAALART